VPPAAPRELGVVLARMIADPVLRQKLAQRAGEVVRTRFSYEAGVEWIASALQDRRRQSTVTARAAE
jgi:glycosyltransferase involved in cell wall biosynthesis